MTFTEQEKKVLFLGAFIAAMMVAGSLYYYVMFVKKEVAANAEKVVKIRKEIKVVEKELNDMKRFMGKEEEVTNMRKIVESTTKRLPSSHNEYEFLSLLINILRVSKVNQHFLKPSAYVAQTLYTEIPYSIDLKARYHEFGSFLNLVEENPDRFIRVNSFQISNDKDRPSIHPIKVVISTFMFNRRAN